MKLTRRKFIFIFLSSITLVFFGKSKTIYNPIIYNSSLKKYIINFNKDRVSNLQNNYTNEIKNDLINGRTIWIKNILYTYAEFSKIIN